MSIENELATHIIRETWEELFGAEEYDVDQLTDKLNEKIKGIRRENAKELEE